jgi:hypothetical protein
MPKIDSNDPRLSRSERRYLEAVSRRLEPKQREPLPQGYMQSLEETFGSCGRKPKHEALFSSLVLPTTGALPMANGVFVEGWNRFFCISGKPVPLGSQFCEPVVLLRGRSTLR